GGLPESERIYCVFCGVPIALPKSKRVPRGGLPFSNERRIEGSALGIIKAHDSGFPDTLRQFAVPRRQTQLPLRKPSLPPSVVAAKRGDTFMPVAQEEPGNASGHPASGGIAQSLRRHVAFLLALLGGFTGGVVIALGAAEYARAREPAPAGAPPLAVAKPAPPPEPAQTPVPASAAPACAAPVPVPIASVAVPQTANTALDRSWLLERARFHQRAYRLGEAERAYRRVLALAPRDSEALAGLGELELLRGTLDQADQRFQQALQANANYLPAKVAVADIRWQAGRAEEARNAYRDIVEHYSAEAYPPYVAQRSASASFPDCDD
ncbi:MAG TPA: tetratricopeptide repeat protein, partial [Polyangiaceae bacterium]|nr:tetratricopeptide repeat protein [Polyangiaceae bacterium]